MMDRVCPDCGARYSGDACIYCTTEAEARAFAASLKARGDAARALSENLVRDVPMLYGSVQHRVGSPLGITDPGIELARIHRKDMVRRSGGGVPPGGADLGRNMLPFERVLFVFGCLWVLADWLG